MVRCQVSSDGVKFMQTIGKTQSLIKQICSYFTPATDDAHYEAFTDSIVSILEFFPFDGIDIDW